MKLAVLLVTLVVCRTSSESGNTDTGSPERRIDSSRLAAPRLEGAPTFGGRRAPGYTEGDESPRSRDSPEVEAGAELPEEARSRIEELRGTASEFLRDPRYAAPAGDRSKRSFISGIANKVIGGAVGAVSGLSRGVSGLSASNAPHEYEPYGQPREKEFGIWDFKKAIINTLIQAIKAIGGGAIAGGGAIVKGGGSLIAAKGRLVSSAGDAIASLGKSLASSAIVAGGKPLYGPPSYTYGAPPHGQPPIIDHVYDGPPPSADAYVAPADAYDADPSSYAAPSNEGDAEPGVAISKETSPEPSDEKNGLSSDNGESNLSALEDSFGGPVEGTTTVAKIIGVLNSGRSTLQDWPDHRHHHGGTDHGGEENSNDQSGINDHRSNGPTYGYGSLPLSDDPADGSNYNGYSSNGEVYDSYGKKLEFSSQSSNDRPIGLDGHRSLGVRIRNVLDSLDDTSKSPLAGNYLYYEGSGHRPFEVSLLGNTEEHLYGPGRPDVTIVRQTSPGGILPQDYRINGPSGSALRAASTGSFVYGPFGGSAVHGPPGGTALESPSGLALDGSYGDSGVYGSFGGAGLYGPSAGGSAVLGPSGGSALLGVWRRTAARPVPPFRKMALLGGATIQRSVGYRSTNGRLTGT